jgi:hypothetical protein
MLELTALTTPAYVGSAVESRTQSIARVAHAPTPAGADQCASSFAATYDATGKLLAQRVVDVPGESPRSAMFHDNAAVVRGNAYVLLEAFIGIRVFELAPDLHEVASVTLTVGPPRSNSGLCRAERHAAGRRGVWPGDAPRRGAGTTLLADLGRLHAALRGVGPGPTLGFA